MNQQATTVSPLALSAADAHSGYTTAAHAAKSAEHRNIVSQYRPITPSPWGNDAALIADGYHAWVDGLTSLAALVSVVGVWRGYPVADPVIGLLSALAILRIVWHASQAVFARLLDRIAPTVVAELRHTVRHVAGCGQSGMRAGGGPVTVDRLS